MHVFIGLSMTGRVLSMKYLHVHTNLMGIMRHGAHLFAGTPPHRWGTVYNVHCASFFLPFNHNHPNVPLHAKLRTSIKIFYDIMRVPSVVRCFRQVSSIIARFTQLWGAAFPGLPTEETIQRNPCCLDTGNDRNQYATLAGGTSADYPYSSWVQFHILPSWRNISEWFELLYHPQLKYSDMVIDMVQRS